MVARGFARVPAMDKTKVRRLQKTFPLCKNIGLPPRLKKTQKPLVIDHCLINAQSINETQAKHVADELRASLMDMRAAAQGSNASYNVSNDVLRLDAHIGGGTQVTLEERKDMVSRAIRHAMIRAQDQVQLGMKVGAKASEMMGGDAEWWAELLTLRTETLTADVKAQINEHMSTLGNMKLQAFLQSRVNAPELTPTKEQNDRRSQKRDHYGNYDRDRDDRSFNGRGYNDRQFDRGRDRAREWRDKRDNKKPKGKGNGNGK